MDERQNKAESLTLPLRGYGFCGSEGGGLPKPPLRNQGWSELRPIWTPILEIERDFEISIFDEIEIWRHLTLDTCV